MQNLKNTFLVLVLFTKLTYAQKVENVIEEQVFLNWYYQNHLVKSKNDNPILYLDKIYTGDLKDDLARDTLIDIYADYKKRDIKEFLVLTKSERQYINNQIDEMTGKKWPEKLFKNSRMLNKDSLKTLYDSLGRRTDNNNYNTGHYGFSKPIFFRNNTLCIFRMYYYCGVLCAHGETVIYIKENRTWTKWLSITEWIS